MEELSRRITIGQYLPTGSTIHRMDPRFKLVAFVIFIVAASSSYSVIANLIVFIAALAALALAKIPLRFALNGLVPAIPIVVIMMVFQLLFHQAQKGEVVWWQWGILNLSPSGVHLVAASVIKFFSIVLIVSTFTLSTALTEITRGLEQLLRPLSKMRFPAHEVALIVTIMLRFVPTLAEEAERLMKAQASRGAAIGTVPRWQVVRRVRGILPLIVPLFVNALRRGEQLALAMEARGYVPGLARSSYSSMRKSARDVVYVLVCLAFCIGVLAIPFPI